MFTAFTPVLHAFFSVNKNYSVLAFVLLSLLLSVLVSVLLTNLDLGISIFSFLYASSTASLIQFAYASHLPGANVYRLHQNTHHDPHLQHTSRSDMYDHFLLQIFLSCCCFPLRTYHAESGLLSETMAYPSLSSPEYLQVHH